MKRLGCHMIGDYMLQSHWMATEKTKNNKVAAIHALTYTIPFVTLRATPKQLALIAASHYVIDRYRLARYVVWAKNRLAPRAYHTMVTSTGMPEETPEWLANTLLIVTDNTLHVLINGLILGDEKEFLEMCHVLGGINDI